MGPHNLYNVDDFCPSMNPDNSSGFELDDWEAAMAVREDGSMPRMDKLLHAAPTCVPTHDPSPGLSPSVGCDWFVLMRADACESIDAWVFMTLDLLERTVHARLREELSLTLSGWLLSRAPQRPGEGRGGDGAGCVRALVRRG